MNYEFRVNAPSVGYEKSRNSREVFNQSSFALPKFAIPVAIRRLPN